MGKVAVLTIASSEGRARSESSKAADRRADGSSGESDT